MHLRTVTNPRSSCSSNTRLHRIVRQHWWLYHQLRHTRHIASPCHSIVALPHSIRNTTPRWLYHLAFRLVALNIVVSPCLTFALARWSHTTQHLSTRHVALRWLYHPSWQRIYMSFMIRISFCLALLHCSLASFQQPSLNTRNSFLVTIPPGLSIYTCPYWPHYNVFFCPTFVMLLNGGSTTQCKHSQHDSTAALPLGTGLCNSSISIRPLLRFSPSSNCHKKRVQIHSTLWHITLPQLDLLYTAFQFDRTYGERIRNI